MMSRTKQRKPDTILPRTAKTLTQTLSKLSAGTYGGVSTEEQDTTVMARTI
jgi:hypothetical protein